MKEITAIRFTVEHKRISVLTKLVVFRLFQRLQILFCAGNVSAEDRRSLPKHYYVSQLLRFRKLTPSDRIDQYFLSWLPMPLSYWLGGVCFLCRDLRRSSFALMEMLVFSGRKIVQLVFALTVALMKSLSVTFVNGKSLGLVMKPIGLDSLRETIGALSENMLTAACIRNSTYCVKQTRSASVSISYGFADSYPVRAWNCGTCGTSSPLLKH